MQNNDNNTQTQAEQDYYPLDHFVVRLYNDADEYTAIPCATVAEVHAQLTTAAAYDAELADDWHSRFDWWNQLDETSDEIRYDGVDPNLFEIVADVGRIEVERTGQSSWKLLSLRVAAQKAISEYVAYLLVHNAAEDSAPQDVSDIVDRMEADLLDADMVPQIAEFIKQFQA